MLGLRAVDPDWCLVGDLDCKCRSDGIARGNRHEAREESSNIRAVVFDGLARLVEGGLGYSVVFWVELELYHISYICYNVVWEIFCRSVGSSYCYDMDRLGKGTGNAHGRE